MASLLRPGLNYITNKLFYCLNRDKNKRLLRHLQLCSFSFVIAIKKNTTTSTPPATPNRLLLAFAGWAAFLVLFHCNGLVAGCCRLRLPSEWVSLELHARSKLSRQADIKAHWAPCKAPSDISGKNACLSFGALQGAQTQFCILVYCT